MGEQKKKNISIGLLAHVDAGKTTLAENLLYTTGVITQKGRVDHQNTFFDTHSLERERGITIFSKQAFFSLGDFGITLLDTPGHVDFGAEMERTLQVLDYAILVINGSDGVQSHTLTLWKLLQTYRIPVFLFVNKMDREENDKAVLMDELQKRLSKDCLDFLLQKEEPDIFYEEIALKEEGILERYLEGRRPNIQEITSLIADRRVYPVVFGSALKDIGVKELLWIMETYLLFPRYKEDFAARVFKIGRDGQNNRLTFIKVTGGSLRVRQLLEGRRDRKGEAAEEKINQIRVYQGEEFSLLQEAFAGQICVLTGLDKSYAGEALGAEQGEVISFLEPVLTYRLLVEEGENLHQVYEKLELLSQEEPELQPEWVEASGEIQIKVMGEIQLEVLKRVLDERFHIKAEFGSGQILYKETIGKTVEGVGHFEPLRHYAEVHLLLEPLPQGSGLEFCSDCSEDILDRNWQRLILTHMAERQHPGVLTGSAITDIRLTLLTGKAHIKHTGGGDFRQATYRAIRQGLMKADSLLLEPVYAFTLEVPQNQVGRAMADIQKMSGKAEFSQQESTQEGMSVLEGTCPVASMGEYSRELMSYTKGRGRLNLSMKGYEPCHNTEEVLEERGYRAQKDEANPCGSIFCFHGAGTYVEWDEVEEYIHLPMVYHLETGEGKQEGQEAQARFRGSQGKKEMVIGTKEIEEILSRTFHANKKGMIQQKKPGWSQRKKPVETTTTRTYHPQPKKEKYLLVDGYNIIFAWEELKELASVTLDGARGRLMDLLCDYQAMQGCQVILVFDAYRLQGHKEETFDYHNIHVVYTREAETADQYIERFTHFHRQEYTITVATSDGLEQIIIRGQGCSLLSARELEEEIAYTRNRFKEMHMDKAAEAKSLKQYMVIPDQAL